jgi:hypothetical protein
MSIIFTLFVAFWTLFWPPVADVPIRYSGVCPLHTVVVAVVVVVVVVVVAAAAAAVVVVVVVEVYR